MRFNLATSLAPCLAPVFALALLLPSGFSPAAAQSAEPSAEAILNDPNAPTAGNPKGTLTIVTFFDYNCPFCKKAEPDLERVVKEDGQIRLVYKDWPILTKASVYGAQMALAAKYQGKYDAVHAALMAIPGPKIPQERMLDAIRNSGVDMAKLDADLKKHGEEINAMLRAHLAQAESLELQGTPAYIVGRFRVTSALTYDQFKLAIADARKQAMK
ncbi:MULTISPECIES: DsbA family protein [Rhodopseudomonas]|uniref:DSBA oxidoreductase n=1 Tax=Rhodopseudomonas palustris TaxID=1076 RepID=A0A0D7EMW2_RHOPL|nr:MULTISPECIES: DsbA family protein [Rhodopseudomonas]KIZ41890.1 DSBA oxidoreductase [Rhodopseudomonas palustris]MDF3812720.1 DsbA family protein [Rhodopseudomonas sp. BAL398]WOK15782.1 DsbA family protein [Rhodopseudomonas sp. BAL398]